ncbi:hypothetical protein [Arthrobacter caoxuetaonis]|uniref:Uncharacterized protein n=1 Tax=Arthrobacter caoxuetaonis TaxID=2886935 RepID=A0A9X1MG04_9MICC|nr:hypothetical protein [Arthrobacter caoxuetaonis]MCC3299363.1 hypothetical protein [Arthrobacter caoxuetaonis]USQ59144.1 hypothetical protein NF551_18735 [Arthrobacter caoxuetaonis]
MNTLFSTKHAHRRKALTAARNSAAVIVTALIVAAAVWSFTTRQASADPGRGDALLSTLLVTTADTKESRELLADTYQAADTSLISDADREETRDLITRTYDYECVREALAWYSRGLGVNDETWDQASAVLTFAHTSNPAGKVIVDGAGEAIELVKDNAVLLTPVDLTSMLTMCGMP